jgi:putative transposase
MAALQLLGIAGYSVSLRAVQGCTSVAGTGMCRSDPCPVPPQTHPSRRPTDLFRFKSQALLDDAALLTCMSYVDLNPIRSKIADRPEDSDFTSIQERIRDYQKTVEQTGNREEAATTAPDHLLPFVGGEHQEKPAGLNFSLPDYLELTDWAGRAIREDKASAIPTELAPILERLNIDPEAWLDSVKNYGKNYNTVIGTREGIKQFSQAIGRKWFCASGFSLQVYQTSTA